MIRALYLLGIIIVARAGNKIAFFSTVFFFLQNIPTIHKHLKERLALGFARLRTWSFPEKRPFGKECVGVFVCETNCLYTKLKFFP